MGDGQGDQRGAERAAGDGDVERGRGVGGGLDQPLGPPDRRDRHGAVKDAPRRLIADRDDPPRLGAGREHAALPTALIRIMRRAASNTAFERVLHARIAEVEGVERQRQRPQAEKRQDGEHEHGPGGGERAAQGGSATGRSGRDR